MSSTILKNKIKFKKTQSDDPLDVGFEIEGFKLRWIRAQSTEDRIYRIWRPIQREDFPKETLEELQRQRFGLWTGGNTIRRGDLVLAMAPLEAVARQKKDIQERNLALQKLVQASPKGIPGARAEYREETPVAADFE
jgi:hypothetical protein